MYAEPSRHDNNNNNNNNNNIVSRIEAKIKCLRMRKKLPSGSSEMCTKKTSIIRAGLTIIVCVSTRWSIPCCIHWRIHNNIICNNSNNNTGSSLGENQISRDACSYNIIYILLYYYVVYLYRNAADVSRVYIIIYYIIGPGVCPSAAEE